MESQLWNTSKRIGRGLGSAVLTFVLAHGVSPQARALELPDPCPDGTERLAAKTPADEALEERVEQRLASSSFERLTDIQVVAIGSTVCLLGTAASPSDRQRAETIVAAVAGVVDVVNRLEIPLAQ